MNAVLIVLFGVSALAFALLVVLVRQPMRAALALVAHMISLAAIFACLGVHVVALFQVLIYVGAVMVFMIYTIMLLDDRDASYVHPFSRWSVAALAVVACVVAALASLLMPAAAPVAAGNAGFGFVEFSVQFMTRYWFHFEVATVLLLVAIVAAWTIVSQRE